ncbi:hypothetical protein, partial [Streptomyces lavendulae]|uniref:hypothetical protein n=1 Tax=Streptomyces lavendulae TaxID=1914 RepID=UPI0031E75458
MSGESDLTGLGTGLEVALTFTATTDDLVAGLAVDVGDVPALVSHPFVTRLEGTMPAHGPVSFSQLTVMCDLEEQRNTSLLGIDVALPALGTGTQVRGLLSSLSTPEGNSVGAVSLETEALAVEPGETGVFPVAQVIAWAGIPAVAVPSPFTGWTAQSLGLWWGAELSSFGVTLEGAREVFGVGSAAGLSFFAQEETTTSAWGTWKAEGQLRVAVPGTQEGEVVFLLRDEGTGQVGDERVMALSAVTEGAVSLASLTDIRTLPFMLGFPDPPAYLLPADLSDLQRNVSLDAMSAVFTQSPAAVRALGAGVHVDVDWTPFAGFTVQEMRLWFLVGLLGQPVRWNAGLEAVCRIGEDLLLTASARFPEGILELRVRDSLDLEGFDADGNLPLPPFDTDLAPVPTGGGPRIALNDLLLTCTLAPPRSYSLDLDLATELSAGPFSLTGVRVSMQYTDGRPPEAVLEASATVYGASALVTVQRGADEWAIRGELQLPTDKTFAQWVLNEFGYTLPGVLDTLQ